MKKIIIEIKSQILYLYIPILISITWGFISHFLNWDDKHLDSILAVYPLIAISSVCYLGFYYLKSKKIFSLLLGLVYLIIIYGLFFLNLLPIKAGDSLTIILLIFYTVFLVSSIIVYLLDKKWSFKLNIFVFNTVLISIIPFALLGYLTILTSLIGLVYWFL